MELRRKEMDKTNHFKLKKIAMVALSIAITVAMYPAMQVLSGNSGKAYASGSHADDAWVYWDSDSSAFTHTEHHWLSDFKTPDGLVTYCIQPSYRPPTYSSGHANGEWMDTTTIKALIPWV
jgi:hypothetical protein